MILRPHFQWNRSSSTTPNQLFQELRANVRPPVGPTGTPCGNRIRGIRHLIKECHGQASIWYWPWELLISHRVGPTQPAAPDGTRRRVWLHIMSVLWHQHIDTHPGDWFVDDTTTGAIYDNHRLEPIPSSASEFTQEEEGLVARMEEII
jgi:hypothetical protein